MKRLVIKVMELPLLIQKIISVGLPENRSVKEKRMKEDLPNILIDGIPFVLCSQSITEFTNPGNIIYKEDIKDEGDFFYLLFDREHKSMVKGMRPYSDIGVTVFRIVLPIDLFTMSAYLRPRIAADFNRVSEEHCWGCKILSNAMAIHLVTELKNRSIKGDDPDLRILVQNIVENFGAQKQNEKINSKPGQKKGRSKGL